LGEFVLVVDPAHGGDRAGSVGAAGIREKDWVLSLARAIQKAGSSLSPRMSVPYARGDYTLPVRERASSPDGAGRRTFAPRGPDKWKERAERPHSVRRRSADGGQDGLGPRFPRWRRPEDDARDFQQFSAIQESARLGEVLKKSLSAAGGPGVGLRQLPWRRQA
jgi:N-acetylmuramoyl-L-alanine amidase